MDRHPVSVLCDYLGAPPRAWVHVAANRLDADWQLSLLEIVVGEPPPGWRRQRWSYERAVHLAAAPAGKTVARWLERERIALPSLSIKLQLDGSVGVERRASNFQGIYQPLPWPTREWNEYVRNNSGQTLVPRCFVWGTGLVWSGLVWSPSVAVGRGQGAGDGPLAG